MLGCDAVSLPSRLGQATQDKYLRMPGYAVKNCVSVLIEDARCPQMLPAMFETIEAAVASEEASMKRSAADPVAKALGFEDDGLQNRSRSTSASKQKPDSAMNPEAKGASTIETFVVAIDATGLHINIDITGAKATVQ